jgi:hypothetical protein
MAIFKTVLETYSATSNADTNIQNGLLQIKNNVSGMPAAPAIFREMVRAIEIDKCSVETATVMRISWTIANSTTYAFRLVAPNGYTYYNFYYTSGASATNSDLGTAIQTWAASVGLATGTWASNNAYIDLTAVAGSPIFGVQTISNITAALQMPTLSATGITTAGVVTVSSGTFATGEIVTITGAGAAVFTDDRGVTSTGTVTARITYASATTFNLDNISVSASVGACTVTKVPQLAFGSPAQVTADMKPLSYTASTTRNYDKMIVKMQNGDEYQFWLMNTLIASTYSAATNISVFYSDINVFQNSAFTSSAWGAPTGTATRTTFATGSVTLPQLAERVKALIDDITALQQKSNSLPLS